MRGGVATAFLVAPLMAKHMMLNNLFFRLHPSNNHINVDPVQASERDEYRPSTPFYGVQNP